MRKLLIILASFLIAVSLFTLTVLLLPFDKRFGRQYTQQGCGSLAVWIYDRIHSNPLPIDVAFLGSSKTCHTINEQLLETMIDTGAHKKIHIANLGYCRFGRNMEYQNLLELTEDKKPQTVVIEVREDEYKFSHVDYGYLADFSEVLNYVYYNPDYIGNLRKAFTIRLDYWKAKLKLTTNFPLLPILKADYSFEKNKNDIADRAYTNQILHKSAEDPEKDRTKNFRFAEYYVKKIAELAKKNNIKLVFLYLPNYSQNIPAPREKELYQSLGTLLIPPSSIFMEPKNFMDAVHMNSKGAIAIDQWLYSQKDKWM